ncbi:MAG: DUF6786 family protein [Chitinophagales bacterium]
MNFSKGQFGYDLKFLEEHIHPIVLSGKNKNQQLIIAPQFQGRIMTSTANGPEGKSFGWINHELIESKKIHKNINPFGGEDRFWMGPEAGQFGLFFKHGEAFTFENSQVPSAIDTEEFDLMNQDATSAVFRKDCSLINYANTKFDIRIERKINLLNEEKIAGSLGINLDSKNDLSVIGFESENSITNLGRNWNKNSGLLSIWIIGMFNATDKATVIIPVKKAKEGINTNYFGALNKNRLQVKSNTVFFRGDGNYRSKIGIAPQSVNSIFGSYDFENDVLTIIQFSFQEDESYVNSLWEIQEEPFKGDVINSYNDGPLNGKQLGGFYEMETSSPAKELKSGESISHLHRTFHFCANKKSLSEIAMHLLNADISSDPLNSEYP